MTTTSGHTNPEPAAESTGILATVRSVYSLLLSYGLLLLANGLFGTLLGVRAFACRSSRSVMSATMNGCDIVLS